MPEQMYLVDNADECATYLGNVIVNLIATSRSTNDNNNHILKLSSIICKISDRVAITRDELSILKPFINEPAVVRVSLVSAMTFTATSTMYADAHVIRRGKTNKLMRLISRLLPRHIREPIIGDLYEEIVEMKVSGTSEKYIRKYLVLQLFYILIETIPPWMKIAFWGIAIAKLKRWIIG